MKKQNVNTILTILSFIVLFYYIFIVVEELYYSSVIKIQNLSALFGNIIVVSIFIINNLFMEDLKRRNVFKLLLKGLLLISVIFLGILCYEVTKETFFNGEDYFWKFGTLLFGIGSIVLIQGAQQKLNRNQKET